MNPTEKLVFKDYVLLGIAILAFFASLICILRIETITDTPNLLASIGLAIVSILFFFVFLFGDDKEDKALGISLSQIDKHFDSFIHQYKDLLDFIFEQIETKDFSTMPLCDIQSYRDFLTMYATTQTKKLSLDRHEKIKSLYTQLDEIIKNRSLVPIPEPCPITALQEEIKQKLEEQAFIPDGITRVEYDNLLDITSPRRPFPEVVLPQLAGFAQTENKVIFGVDANESGFAPTAPEPSLPYKAIPSVPDEEEMQKIKEQAATVATDIIADAVGKSDDELMQSLRKEAFALTPTPEAEKELMQSLREEAIAASFDISKDAIKASPKRTKSGRFAKKSK